MKSILTALLLVSSVFADTPTQISADYREAAAAAVVKVNGALEKDAAAVIAKLVTNGDAAGAEELTAQVKAKLNGEPVPVVQADAALLFEQYDADRAKALAPLQMAGILRVDSLLKAAAGATPETVKELEKVRTEIGGLSVGGMAAVPVSSPAMISAPATVSKPAAVLTPSAGAAPAPAVVTSLPEEWTYQAEIDGVVLGHVWLRRDGSFELKDDNSRETGTWKPTSDGFEVKVGSETWPVTVEKGVGTLKRSSGTRYVRGVVK